MGWSAGKDAYYGIQQRNGYKRHPAFKHFETDSGYGTLYYNWRVEHKKGRAVKRNHQRNYQKKGKIVKCPISGGKIIAFDGAVSQRGL